MKKIFLTISVTISLVLILFASTSTRSIAQETELSDQKVKVYVSDTCPYCQELLNTLEEQNLLDTVDVIEISQEPYSTEFRAVVEECQVKSAVPLLYDGERCFQGQYTSLDRIYVEQGIDPTESADEDRSEDTDQTTSIEQSSTNSIEETDEGSLNDEPQNETTEDQAESSTLSEKIFGAEVQNGPPDIPPLNMIVMLIAPITLLGLGYYIITKMKI